MTKRIPHRAATGKTLHAKHEGTAAGAQVFSSGFAAIIESSNDAILTKTLDGTITSWNRGAERIYGYEAKEAIGRPIGLIIPADRSGEMQQILARIRKGESIEHFETIREKKGGELKLRVKRFGKKRAVSS